MISGALGLRPSMSKEEKQKEREKLKEAKGTGCSLSEMLQAIWMVMFIACVYVVRNKFAHQRTAIFRIVPGSSCSYGVPFTYLLI